MRRLATAAALSALGTSYLLPRGRPSIPRPLSPFDRGKRRLLRDTLSGKSPFCPSQWPQCSLLLRRKGWGMRACRSALLLAVWQLLIDYVYWLL
jgi:hypothetical protein